MKKEITYIVNTYNRREKLEKALVSILGQKEVSFDILVIDDCSTSKDFNLEELRELYPTVTFYQNKSNIGLAASRQKGLEMSQTEFISFLDDDDMLIDEMKTRRHLDYLLQNENVAVICSDIVEYDGTYRFEKSIRWPENLLEHLMKRNGIIYPSTTTCRRSCFIQSGGFDFKFRRGIDSDVYRRLVLSGYKIVHDDTKTVLYLVEAKDKITDDVTNSGLYKNIESNVLTLQKYYKYFSKHPLSAYQRVKNIVYSFLLIIKLNFESK